MVETGRSIFHVRLTPKAAKTGIGEWVLEGDNAPYLKVSVTVAPEKGKANAALVALLSKEWKIPKSCIWIEKGETDRHKTLSVPVECRSFVEPF